MTNREHRRTPGDMLTSAGSTATHFNKYLLIITSGRRGDTQKYTITFGNNGNFTAANARKVVRQWYGQRTEISLFSRR